MKLLRADDDTQVCVFYVKSFLLLYELTGFSLVYGKYFGSHSSSGQEFSMDNEWHEGRWLLSHGKSYKESSRTQTQRAVKWSTCQNHAKQSILDNSFNFGVTIKIRS